MNGSEAVTVCRHCGRAVCRVHAKEGPVLDEVVASYGAGATRKWLRLAMLFGAAHARLKVIDEELNRTDSSTCKRLMYWLVFSLRPASMKVCSNCLRLRIRERSETS